VAPANLAPRGHGEIPPQTTQDHPPPASQDHPPPTTSDHASQQTDQPDAMEQARARAWQAYYQRVDALAQKRLDMNMQSLNGGKHVGYRIPAEDRAWKVWRR